MSDPIPVCLITGPTHGIGKAAAIALSEQGVQLVLGCRNVGLGESLRDSLPGPAHVMHVDLGEPESVVAFSNEVRGAVDRLDILVNNAGIMTTDGSRIGELDAMMAVNHLGPCLLTRRLLELCLATPGSRIVNVASRAHQRATADISDPLCAKSRLGGMGAYGQSKLANVLFTLALARRLEGTSTTCNALHPGVVGTNIMANAGGWLRLLGPIAKPFMLSESEGAKTLLYLALDDAAAELNGMYLDEKQRVKAPSRLAQNEELQEALWTASEELLSDYL